MLRRGLPDRSVHATRARDAGNLDEFRKWTQDDPIERNRRMEKGKAHSNLRKTRQMSDIVSVPEISVLCPQVRHGISAINSQEALLVLYSQPILYDSHS